MPRRLVTEVMVLNSLQELTTYLEAEIKTCTTMKEKYSEQLGGFLREAEEKYGDEDWFKELSLDKIGKTRRRRRGKKGLADWIQFQNIELSSSIQGEAEVMFDIIEALTKRIVELEEVKDSIEELKNIGFGNDVNYICLIKDGLVERIVIKPIEEGRGLQFTYNMGFSGVQVISNRS